MMDKNSIIAGVIAFSLINVISANIDYAQQVFPTSMVQLTKTTSGMSTASASPSATTSPASSKPQQDITKIKITSPTRGQQVPVGKDLTISGTSINNTSASTNDCKVSVRVNKVSPYQPATAATTTATGTAGDGGTGPSAAGHDYSKWNFVLIPKLSSGAVCIKDITPPTKTTASPLPTTPITNSTKSSSLPLPSANQPNTNPASNDSNSDSNNEENFNTKILKSFNKEFK
jgi:hypothetical protein